MEQIFWINDGHLLQSLLRGYYFSAYYALALSAVFLEILCILFISMQFHVKKLISSMKTTQSSEKIWIFYIISRNVTVYLLLSDLFLLTLPGFIGYFRELFEPLLISNLILTLFAIIVKLIFNIEQQKFASILFNGSLIISFIIFVYAIMPIL